MEKILIFAVVICLLVSLLSCAAKEPTSSTSIVRNVAEEQSTTALTTQKTTSVSVKTTTKKEATTINTIQSAVQIVAQLLNEDGTGTINVNMSREEVALILDKHGISYKYNGKEFIDIESGMRYKRGWFNVIQTQKGLKVGDSVARVYELYSGAKEAFNVDEENNEAYFQFIWNKKLDVSGSFYNTYLMISLNKDQSVVEGIGIGLVGDF
jgi:hypothetical protein